MGTLDVIRWSAIACLLAGCYRTGPSAADVPDAAADADSDTDSDADSDTDTDTDSDSDADSDTGTDTDVDSDADTDTSTETGSDPTAGSSCDDPVVVPDAPLEWSFVSDWMYFTENTFDGSMTNCEDNLGNTAWFEVGVPAEHRLELQVNGGPVVWANFLEGCAAAACLHSDLGTATNAPTWGNTSSEPGVVLVAVESNISLASALIDWTFVRAPIP